MAVPAYGQETVTSFSDVKPGQWFYEYVMTLTGKGVITGVTKPVNGVGKYDPQGTVTLGQFLAIATRLVAAKYIKEVPNPRHWAEPNYNAAVESGLIGKGDFGNSPAYLNTPISREDMAYILVNMAKLNGETLDLYSGMAYPNGELLTPGDIGSVYHGDMTYLGQPYLVDKKTGEGHFRSDWIAISSYEAELAIKTRNPKDGQRVGYWTVYFEDLGGWYWTGPR